MSPPITYESNNGITILGDVYWGTAGGGSRRIGMENEGLISQPFYPTGRGGL